MPASRSAASASATALAPNAAPRSSAPHTGRAPGISVDRRKSLPGRSVFCARMGPVLDGARLARGAGGAAVHVVPGATWRFWTSVAAVAYAVAYAAGRRRPPPGAEHAVDARAIARGAGIWALLRRAAGLPLRA